MALKHASLFIDSLIAFSDYSNGLKSVLIADNSLYKISSDNEI